jgi:hypothetical protein
MKRFLFFCILLSVGAVLVGCQTPLAVMRLEAKNPFAKNAAKTPTHLVDVWNSYAQVSADGKTVRGLAGRIHFYDNNKKKQAVKVEGNLSVFVFDSKETDPAHAKPLKVFEFPVEVLNEKHYTYKKPFGHGYNFFLPFDEIGGAEQTLCIMTRFDDKLENALVLAKPVNTILAGTKSETPKNPTVQEFLASRSILAEANQTIAEQNGQDGGIQQVGYIEPTKKQPELRNISTIRLNDTMAKRLGASENSSPATNAKP